MTTALRRLVIRLDQEADAGPVEFAVHVVTDETRPKVIVHGEIDLATAGQLTAALDAATEMASAIELDLGGTTFMDSSGLAVLIDTQFRLGQIPEAIVLRDPNPTLRRLLALGGIEHLFTICPSEPSASV